MSGRLPPVSPSKSVCFGSYAFKSLTHFEIISVYHLSEKSKIILVRVITPFTTLIE